MQLFASIRHALPAVFLLLTLIQMNFHILPVYWPDEALFSSPAAELYKNGSFATPVLKGLIPGMGNATLWNSPLYMVLLSGIYSITGGESLEWARGLSMILAIFSLAAFAANLQFFASRFPYISILPAVLVMDPVFQRAANTARMDILVLLFFLLAHYFLLLDFTDRPHKGRLRPLLAGVFTGLAGLSHPFAVFFVPVLVIYLLPDIKKILIAAAGTAAGILPWLFYIIPHFEIFKIQFLSQLTRKSDIFYLWGGETGGVLKVFFSQFGNAWIMIFAAFVFAAVFGSGLLYIWRIRKHWKTNLFIRLFASFALLVFFILISSEGWYVLYASPFLIMTALYLADNAFLECRILYKISLPAFPQQLPLAAAAVLFCTAASVFVYKNHIRDDASLSVKSYLQSSVNALKGCRSVYLRVRPDPYFHLKKENPETQILEFVPGKLQFDGMKETLLKKYETIHCFYVDRNESWEPVLSGYLNENEDEFEVRELNFRQPASESRLYIRK